MTTFKNYDKVPLQRSMTELYYKHGKLHRIGGPAVIHATGLLVYYHHGSLTRDDGGPCIREVYFNDNFLPPIVHYHYKWCKDYRLYSVDNIAVISQRGWYQRNPKNIKCPVLKQFDDADFYEGRMYKNDSKLIYDALFHDISLDGWFLPTFTLRIPHSRFCPLCYRRLLE